MGLELLEIKDTRNEKSFKGRGGKQIIMNKEEKLEKKK